MKNLIGKIVFVLIWCYIFLLTFSLCSQQTNSIVQNKNFVVYGNFTDKDSVDCYLFSENPNSNVWDFIKGVHCIKDFRFDLDTNLMYALLFTDDAVNYKYCYVIVDGPGSMKVDIDFNNIKKDIMISYDWLKQKYVITVHDEILK